MFTEPGEGGGKSVEVGERVGGASVMVCGQPLAQLQVEKLEIRRLGDSSAPVPRAVTDYMDSQWGQKAMRPTISADGMEFAVDTAFDDTIEVFGCSIRGNHFE